MAKGKYEYWLTDEGLLRIAGWARDGLIDSQIAKNMGVAYSTLREWVKKFPALSAVIKESKEVVDREVENALLKRALGYTHTETKTKKEAGVITEVTTTVKEIVPDVTAQIFWLKNRKPETWRDKVVYTDESELEKLDDLIGSIDRLAGKGGREDAS